MTRPEDRLGLSVLLARRCCTYVDAHGDVDLGTSTALARAIDEAALASERVVLDLRDVAFLDPAALAVLHHATTRHAGTLSIVPPEGGPARRMLDVLALEDALLAA